MTETAFPGGGSLDPNSYPGTDSERIEQAARAAFAAGGRCGFRPAALMRFRRAASG